jgi:hypothetical protein
MELPIFRAIVVITLATMILVQVRMSQMAGMGGSDANSILVADRHSLTIRTRPIWPGKPTSSLSAAPDDMKLVRIGTGGPVADVRSFFLEHLDEFIQVYQNRPDKTNTCGIRISHALAIYTIATRLQPSTIIESGINSGQSTYFFRAAAPNAKIISIDPEAKPICGQPVRWIDETNNEYLTGEQFIDFDAVNWEARVAAGELNPATTLVFIDDHRGFFNRFPTFYKVGFRHLINEDNYKRFEGATGPDKAGLAPKQMFQKVTKGNTEWLFHHLKIYAEFPPLLSPVASMGTSHTKKKAGGFLHHTDDLGAMEEPLLRPDVNAGDKVLLDKIAAALQLDATLQESQSYQEFMGYCFISYMELVPLAPMIKRKWKLAA